MDNLPILKMWLLWLLCGPMVWIALGVFLAGTVWQVLCFYRFTRLHPDPPGMGKRPAVPKEDDLLDRTTIGYRLSLLKLTLPGQRPFFAAMTVFFHAGLLVLPFFVQGHTMMAGFSTGIFLPALPNVLVDLLTLAILLCALVFLVRRYCIREVRSITTVSDIALLTLATTPFVTGFVAYHQFFDYRTMIAIHMASGELMLMLIPFTRLIHMVYFFLNRFILVHQLTLGRGGTRAWSPLTPINKKGQLL